MAVDRKLSAEGADFVDVVVFDRLAEVCASHLSKGRQVALSGRLRSSEWTTDSGERRSRRQVVADEVGFLDAPKSKAATDPETREIPDVPPSASTSASRRLMGGRETLPPSTPPPTRPSTW
jgi:single stranded DNA-binding protein